ncbi:MAG: hypothetical protein ABI977_11935 [Acidobacteriota bacterium]
MTGIVTGLAWLFTLPQFNQVLPASWGNKILVIGVVLNSLLAKDGNRNPGSTMKISPREWKQNGAPLLMIGVFLIALMAPNLSGCAKPAAQVPKAPATRQDVAKQGVVAAANIYEGLTRGSDLIEQLNKGIPQVLSDEQALAGYKTLRKVGLITKDFKDAAIRFGTVDGATAPTLKAFVTSALSELATLQSLKFKDESKRQTFLAYIRSAQQGYETYQLILQLFQKQKTSATAEELGVPQLQKLEGALREQI